MSIEEFITRYLSASPVGHRLSVTSQLLNGPSCRLEAGGSGTYDGCLCFEDGQAVVIRGDANGTKDTLILLDQVGNYDFIYDSYPAHYGLTPQNLRNFSFLHSVSW